MAATGPPGQGYKYFLQLGRETAGNYGVAVAATHRYRVLSLRPEVSSGLIDSDVVDGTGLLLGRYLGKKSVGFVAEVELTHTNFLFLWDLALGTGTYGSSGGATTGPVGADYTHTFKHKDLLNSVTAQLGIGDIPTAKCERATGCKLAQVAISGSFHTRMIATLTFRGQNYETNVTPTALAAPAAQDCVLFDSMSAFNDGIGSTGTILGLDLAIDNMTPDRDHANVLIEEPLRQDFPTMSMTVREEFQSRSALDAQLAMTSGVPSFTFTSGAKILTLAFGAAHLTDPVLREPEGRGRVVQPLVWKPIAAGSPATYLTVTQVNTQATIITYP